MIHIHYHTDLNEALADARLAVACAAPVAQTPFDRAEWWRGLTQDCGLVPLFACARCDSASMLLALMRGHASRWGRGRIEALTTWYDFRWRPVFSGEEAHDTDAYDILLTALARDLARQVDRVTLAPLPDEDATTTRLAAAFRRAGWVAERAVIDTNHILRPMGRDFATYLSARPGALRGTLTKKARRVATAILAGDWRQAWADYEAVYAASWKPAEGSPDFLRHFAAAEHAAGRLRLGIAYAEGRAIAAQLWSVEAGTAFIHKMAYDRTAQALSPGTVLTAAVLAHVIDQDQVTLVDFGTGDDAYKRTWTEETRLRYRLDMFRVQSPRRWPHIARIGWRRLARATKTSLPHQEPRRG